MVSHMKIQPLLVYVLSAAFFLLMACQENKVPPSAMSGDYEGTFQISDARSGYTNSGPVALSLSGEGYVCAGNQQRLPAGGNGSFKRKPDIIEFEDQNVWPPHFDMHLVLTGEFHYAWDDTSLHLWKEIATMRYDYFLEKQ
jgi:hypothetical protein